MVEQRTHKPLVGSSNLPPATINESLVEITGLFFYRNQFSRELPHSGNSRAIEKVKFMRCLRFSRISLILSTCLLLCVGSQSIAHARPGGSKPEGEVNVLVLLRKADLKLKRLLLAQATSDLPLSIQELDDCQGLLDETQEWLKSQGPIWNNANSQTVLAQVTEAIRFSRFMMEAGLGVEKNLSSQVDYFLEQGYKPSQQMSLLVIATQSSALRGRLEEARTYSARAQAIAKSAPNISPVALYALASSVFRVERLSGRFKTPEEILAQYQLATSSLKNYTPGQNPLYDIDWLLAREATMTWVEELRGLGPSGVPGLLQILHHNQKLEAALQKGWDHQKLEAAGLNGLPAAYITFFATHVLLYTHADQQVSVCEALPVAEARAELSPERIGRIEAYLAHLPDSALIYTDKNLGPEFTEFGLGRGGLAEEMAGRVQFMKARFEPTPSQKMVLLEQALAHIQKSGDEPTQVRYLSRVAEIALELNKPELAAEKWKQALEICQARGLILSALQLRELLAERSLQARNWNEVKTYCNAGLAQIEEAIPLAGRDSQAARDLRVRSHHLSRLLAQASVESDDAEGALSALSLGHDYNLAVTQVGSKKDASADLKLAEHKQDEVAVLSKKVDQLKAMPASSTRDSLLVETEKLLADSRSDFLLQSRLIRQKHATLYSSVLRFDPLSLPDIQSSLSPEAAVVQYFPTEQELYIFLVTKESFRLRSTKTPKGELEQEVSQMLRQIRRVSGDSKALDLSARKLYQRLIAPIEADLVDKSSLVIIPAGQLNFLPFGALQNADGRNLVELRSLQELATPTDFIKVANSSASKLSTVTVFANATGDLPAATREGQRICAIFSGSKLFGESKATKENFLKFGGEGSALHLATHGEWDPSDSLNNYLLLADNERVTQEEIFSLPFNGVSLVTLSACNTAMAKGGDMDYVSSLAEAFWIAGARSVVASLWAVDDDSTSMLMTEFYSAVKAGKTKVEALREAQLAVRANKIYAHPYFWAGFVLFGDGR